MTDLASKFAGKSLRSKGGCLLWTGCLNHGYGHFRHQRKSWRAHRAAWTVTYGPIPVGMHVCHKCDVRHCIEPSHLFLGTNADNTEDRRAKGRSAKQAGEANGRAKLTTKKAALIRSWNGPLKILRERYKVSEATITKIRAGDTWRVT